MTHQTRLLGLAVALGVAAPGCFIDLDDDDDDVVFLGTYEPCESTSQCLPDDVCLEVTADYGSRIVTDAICTHGCLEDVDCPLSVTGLRGACYDIGQGFFCYERCIDDFDCPAGFGCVETVGGVIGDAVCLPE